MKAAFIIITYLVAVTGIGIVTGTGPGPVVGTEANGRVLSVAVEDVKREAVEQVLTRPNGNVAEAAAQPGVFSAPASTAS